MGLLTQSVITLTAIFVGFLGVILYTPLPDGMEKPWKLRVYYAKSKMAVITSELAGMLGYSSINVSRTLLDQIALTNGSSDNDPHLDVSNIVVDGIQTRIYKPKNKAGLLPCFIFYHGGGFVYSINTYDGVTARIAHNSEAVVVSVEYRRIPEFPYPAAIDDGYKAVLYFLKNGRKHGIDTSKISIGGDSAGGNMAASIALKLRDNKVQPKLAAQVLVYPVLQACDLHTPSHELGSRYLYNGRTFAANIVLMYLDLPERFRDLIANGKFSSPELTSKCKRFVSYRYLSSEFLPQGFKRTDVTAESVDDDVKLLSEKMADPYFCPLMEEDLSNLPDTLIITVELDHIRDDGVIYARRLQKAGVRSQWYHINNSFHGVLTMIGGDNGFEGGEIMIDRITLFLKSLH